MVIPLAFNILPTNIEQKAKKKSKYRRFAYFFNEFVIEITHF
jgi:hypothetical protein